MCLSHLDEVTSAGCNGDCGQDIIEIRVRRNWWLPRYSQLSGCQFDGLIDDLLNGERPLAPGGLQREGSKFSGMPAPGRETIDRRGVRLLLALPWISPNLGASLDNASH
jgi:hypothetical protein